MTYKIKLKQINKKLEKEIKQLTFSDSLTMKFLHLSTILKEENLFFLFRDRVLLYSSGWSPTLHPPAQPPELLGLQTWASFFI